MAWWTDGLKCADMEAGVLMFKSNLLGLQATRRCATVVRNKRSRRAFCTNQFWEARLWKFSCRTVNLLREKGASALAVTKTKIRSWLQPERDFKCSFSIHDRGLKNFQNLWKIKIYINIPITVVIMHCDSNFFSKIIVYNQQIVTIRLYYYF
jgi:hypothetical protein